jgi:hypothetical protein
MLSKIKQSTFTASGGIKPVGQGRGVMAVDAFLAEAVDRMA